MLCDNIPTRKKLRNQRRRNRLIVQARLLLTRSVPEFNPVSIAEVSLPRYIWTDLNKRECRTDTTAQPPYI